MRTIPQRCADEIGQVPGAQDHVLHALKTECQDQPLDEGAAMDLGQRLRSIADDRAQPGAAPTGKDNGLLNHDADPG